MANRFNESINNLLDELNKRMEILNITMPPREATANYEQVADIIRKSLGKDIKDLTIEDVTNFDSKDLARILKLIGFQQDALDDYLADYERHVIKSQVAKGLEDVRTVQDFFHRLLDTLKDYRQDYENYTTTAALAQEKNQRLYQKYIDLFSHKDNSLFEDFSELNKLLSSLGISKEDQWQILAYLAHQNVENMKMPSTEIDMYFQINHETNKYLVPENPVLEVLKEYVKKNPIDIEHLDFIACDFAANFSLEYDLVYDTLVSIVLNDLKEKKNPDRENIDYLLKSLVPIHNETLKKAEQLIREKQAFFDNSLAGLTRDIYDYLDLSLKEIMSEGTSLDEAIDLKSLPILKTLMDSLKKADSLSSFSEDYKLSSEIISELLTAYDNLMAKRENSKEY